MQTIVEFCGANERAAPQQIWLQAMLESAAELSTASRAIRTPANAASGIADLLWEQHLGQTEREPVEVFRSAVTSLLNRANEILELSNLESGRFELEHIDFDLRSIVDRALRAIGAKAQAKRLTLKSKLSPGLPGTITGDPIRLRQILANLLDKAVTLGQKGEIAISVDWQSTSQTQLHFEVTYNGIQAETSIAGYLGRTGLTSDLCRKLALKMGGKLDWRSEPGKGGAFTFDVDFACGSHEKCAERTTAAKPASAASAHQLVRLLIAEDSEDSRFLLREFLKKGPYELTFAENGKEAMDAAGSQPFDLILMDIQMPVMDGLTATRLIREGEREAGRPATPLLALTGNARKADIELSLAAGCNAHVLKPISQSELLKTIQRYAPVRTAQEWPSSLAVNRPDPDWRPIERSKSLGRSRQSL
jgi:CheY-like chemotaxis protein